VLFSMNNPHKTRPRNNGNDAIDRISNMTGTSLPTFLRVKLNVWRH